MSRNKGPEKAQIRLRVRKELAEFATERGALWLETLIASQLVDGPTARHFGAKPADGVPVRMDLGGELVEAYDGYGFGGWQDVTVVWTDDAAGLENSASKPPASDDQEDPADRVGGMGSR